MSSSRVAHEISDASTSEQGLEVGKKWGGFVVEGDPKLYKPLDFLPGTLVINGERLDVDKMSSVDNVNV
jgi:hypothetical protein